MRKWIELVLVLVAVAVSARYANRTVPLVASVTPYVVSVGGFSLQDGRTRLLRDHTLVLRGQPALKF